MTAVVADASILSQVVCAGGEALVYGARRLIHGTTGEQVITAPSSAHATIFAQARLA